MSNRFSKEQQKIKSAFSGIIGIIAAFFIVISAYSIIKIGGKTAGVIVGMMMVYSAALIWFLSKEWKNNHVHVKKTFRNQFAYSRELLESMKCSCVEYDVNTKQISTNEFFKKSFEFRNIDGPREILYEFLKEHREFDFEELKKIISFAIIDKKVYSLECVIQSRSRSLVWLMMKIIPGEDEKGNVSKVYIVVMDETGNHTAFEKVTNVMDRYPLGFCRISRGRKIRLEYAGEGLRRLLGYEREEFTDLIENDNDFLNFIHEEDREKYTKCIHGLVSDGVVSTLYYRLRKSDGTYIRVLDAMEFGISSAGVLNVYSAIIDVTNYDSANNSLMEEIDDMKAQLLREKIKNSVDQLRPHYIYNALSSIREIVMDNPIHAYNLIYDFTVQLRSYVKASTNENPVDFVQELENVKSYLNIEKVRFDELLKVEYDISETDFTILPLSVQTLVENAVRHGIFKRGATGGTVTIRSFCDDNFYHVCVEDNGVGFEVDETLKRANDHVIDSTGLTNLKFRLHMLADAKLIIESEPGIGTTASILIPKEKKHENNNC